MDARWLVTSAVVLIPALAWAAPPGEVGPAKLAGQTLSWDLLVSASSYNVYRGEVPANDDHRCLVFQTSATSATLPDAPPNGLFYYLVSAVNADGEGPLGFRSAVPVRNDFPCDVDGDGIPSAIDNCPAVFNPSQTDQNADQIGDRCDPKTYDFEADAVGARPLEMTQIGGDNPSFVVRDLGGDLACAYITGVGIHDYFDRLRASYPHQDTTVYVDYELVPETISIELWSDGAYSWNAGAGLILQIFEDGALYFYQRHGDSVPQVLGPLAPASGRMRLRLMRTGVSQSELHVDQWDGSAWIDSVALFTIADDHTYRALGISLGDYIGGRRALRRITVEHTVPARGLTLHQHPGTAVSYKLFQRDPAGVATIPLRFSYRMLEDGVVRARVVDYLSRNPIPGHDWGVHEVALARANPGEGALDMRGVPTGGAYDVEVELLRASDRMIVDGDVITKLAVGDVYLAAGQSNMSGYSGGLGSPETPIDQALLFHNDFTWKIAEEPMDGGIDQVDRVSWELPAHSLMLRFAKDLFIATGVPVGIIPGSLGATNLFDQWQRNDAVHDDRGTLYGSLLHRAALQNYDNPPAGLLWFQGESDAADVRTTSDYITDLERLISQYREDLGNSELSVLIGQLGTFDAALLDDWLAIQEAQRQVVERDSRTALIATVDQPRADAIHFDVDGYKAIGARFAEAARELAYGDPIDARTRLLDADAVLAPDVVELIYDAPGVTAGAASLYRVVDDGAPVAITGTSVVASSIFLNLARPLLGSAFVSYGRSTSPGAGWARDSRGVALAVFQSVPIVN